MSHQSQWICHNTRSHSSWGMAIPPDFCWHAFLPLLAVDRHVFLIIIFASDYLRKCLDASRVWEFYLLVGSFSIQTNHDSPHFFPVPGGYRPALHFLVVVEWYTVNFVFCSGSWLQKHTTSAIPILEHYVYFFTLWVLPPSDEDSWVSKTNMILRRFKLYSAWNHAFLPW